MDDMPIACPFSTIVAPHDGMQDMTEGGGVVVWNINHQIKIERDLDPNIIRDRKIMV